MDVDVTLSFMGVEGLVSHDSNDDLLYCDAKSDNGDIIVATGKDLNELIDSFKTCVLDYLDWVE
jgi:hypothetical protein